MKIEGNHNIAYISNEKAQNAIKESIEKQTKAEGQKDVFNFNTSASELNMFIDMAKATDEVRYDKIKELQEKEGKGEYQITGKDVILKLMEEKTSDGVNY